MNQPDWYGARTVFQVTSDTNNAYEERIVLISALSIDEAIIKAETEARHYAQSTNSVYIEYVGVYRISDLEIADGMEVYSLLRQSCLNAEQYISRFFDTGFERSAKELFNISEYSGSFLMELAYGTSRMEPALASGINHLISVEKIAYDRLARRLTSSTLDKGEAYMLGKALAERAREFAQLDRE